MNASEMTREPSPSAADGMSPGFMDGSSRRNRLEQRDWAWHENRAGTEPRVESGREAAARVDSVSDATFAANRPVTGRRALRAFARSLVQRIATSPSRYRLIDDATGSLDVADWHTLMLSIEYLRDNGFEMSTLRVEPITT